MDIALRPNVDWVGCVDWNVRDFHSFETLRGATYNAYLLRDRKTALIDAVKAPFAERLLENVAALCDPASVDYVVCNHAEPDHSGALPAVMRAMPRAVLVCDKKCADALAAHYDASSWKFQLVAGGDRLGLGDRSLQFVETPMVHWPESMFTYVPEEKLLFSMDAFGQHYASSQRFDDQAPLGIVMDEAKTYYANIVMPYAKAVEKCLEQAASLEIDVIAPSHGVVWRSHAAEIVAAYRGWAAGRLRPKVLVVYDTMWESTAAMAAAIAEGASQPGVEVQLIHVRRTGLTRIAAESLDAAAMALGCSTLNRGMMPQAAAVLSYLEGLRPPAKAALAFGSHGWGRGAAEAIDQWLREMSWEIVREPIRARYCPAPDVLEACRAAGKLLADRAGQLAGPQASGGGGQ